MVTEDFYRVYQTYLFQNLYKYHAGKQTRVNAQFDFDIDNNITKATSKLS